DPLMRRTAASCPSKGCWKEYLRMRHLVHLLSLCLLTCAAVVWTPPAAAAAQSGDRMRALWITRWDYRSADDVRKAIENAAWLGTTDVIWQVRGQGDAFYRSELEPWGHELL